MRFFLVNFEFFPKYPFCFFLVIFLCIFCKFSSHGNLHMLHVCLNMIIICCFVPSVFIWECLKTEVSQKSYFCTKKMLQATYRYHYWDISILFWLHILTSLVNHDASNNIYYYLRVQFVQMSDLWENVCQCLTALLPDAIVSRKLFW